MTSVRSLALTAFAVAAFAIPGVLTASAGDGFWDAPEPRSDYQRAMDLGDRYSQRAGREVRRMKRHYARLAADAYEQAAALDPKAAEPHFRAAKVLYGTWVENSNLRDETQTVRVIEHFDAFERLAPLDPRLTTKVLFDRALSLSKLGGEKNFLRSVEDYDRLLALGDPANQGLYLSNSAEALMAAGRLERAVERYEDAFETYPKPLHRHGLAVALDRDGQEQRARELLREAIRPERGDPAPMAWLRQGGVFFIPYGDVLYYRALGHDAVGDFANALVLFRHFVRVCESPLYKPRALAHIRRLEAMPRAKRGRKTIDLPGLGRVRF